MFDTNHHLGRTENHSRKEQTYKQVSLTKKCSRGQHTTKISGAKKQGRSKEKEEKRESYLEKKAGSGLSRKKRSLRISGRGGVTIRSGFEDRNRAGIGWRDGGGG